MYRFLDSVIGYTGNSTQYDSILMYASVFCVVVLFILAVYFLVHLVQWLWGVFK